MLEFGLRCVLEKGERCYNVRLTGLDRVCLNSEYSRSAGLHKLKNNFGVREQFFHSGRDIRPQERVQVAGGLFEGHGLFVSIRVWKMGGVQFQEIGVAGC